MASGCPSGIICSSGIPRVAGFPVQNFRYFNQPIEQIPGWAAGVSQILVHPNDGGLMWKNVECMDVITCIRLEPSGLKIECRNIMAISINPSSGCQDIPATSCPSG